MTPHEQELIETLASFELDPLGFVRWAFPWGEPGPLEDEELEAWQEDEFGELGEHLQAGRKLNRFAVASGHGVGKSAGTGMLTWWAMSTMPFTKGVITANTETQLKTKTWPEISKWHRLFIGKDLFEVTATAIFPRDADARSTWRIDMVPWSERNTEAFAGLHNIGRRVFLLMDEASAIPDVIHEVSEGALTDVNTQIIWGMFGNPTRNTGRFRESAPDGRFGQRWRFRSVDSRTVRRTNKTQIKEWEDDYGEDSDFFRVRVKGQFPRADTESFIPFELVRKAIARPPLERNDADVVLGVDVGRFGTDPSVIYPRQGLDARSRPPLSIFNADTIKLAGAVRNYAALYNVTYIFVDETGVGGGLVDVLRNMRLPAVIIPVQFGSKPDGTSANRYANKRAEIWGEMLRWLQDGGIIPEDLPGNEDPMSMQLTAPMYGFDAKDQILLESKRDMRRRGSKAPDAADALACTFALPLAPIMNSTRWRGKERPTIAPDYDPMEMFHNEPAFWT